MKFLIILLLFFLVYLFYSRNTRLEKLLLARLKRKKYRLPNELIYDAQHTSGDVNAVLNSLTGLGYSIKRKFELTGQTMLYLLVKNGGGSSSFIDLLTGGEEAELASAETKVIQQGGQYGDINFHGYVLFPDQQIILPPISTNLRPPRRTDPKPDYDVSKQPNRKKQTETRITKTIFRDAPGSPIITFDQGTGNTIKIGLIDSRADFTQFTQFEEALDVSDAYLNYLQDGSNDFGGLNLNIEDAHGTFMASIIADQYAGECELKIRSYPFHDGNAGHLMELLAAIYSAVNSGVDILNLSLGYFQDGVDAHLQRALVYARSNDVFVVCSAGNFLSNNDVNGFWPANLSQLDNVVSIAAVDDLGNTWTESAELGTNFGDVMVSFATKGDDVVGFVNDTDKALLSGTSCSAAVLSAIAAQIKCEHPAFSAAQIKGELISRIGDGTGIFNA